MGRVITSVVLRVLDSMDATEVKNPGPFCSQLICGALEQSGVRCFKTKRDPTTVGPNDFLNSTLKPVAGLIRPASRKAETDLLYLKSLRIYKPLTRRQQTGPAVQALRSIADARRAAAAIEKLRQGF